MLYAHSYLCGAVAIGTASCADERVVRRSVSERGATSCLSFRMLSNQWYIGVRSSMRDEVFVTGLDNGSAVRKISKIQEARDSVWMSY